MCGLLFLFIYYPIVDIDLSTYKIQIKNHGVRLATVSTKIISFALGWGGKWGCKKKLNWMTKERRYLGIIRMGILKSISQLQSASMLQFIVQSQSVPQSQPILIFVNGFV